MDSLQIETVRYQDKTAAIEQIRTTVFQIEQGISADLEFDGLDKDSIHLLAYSSGEAVGTTRIREIDGDTAKIERLAVLSSARNKGIGKQLMRSALDVISQQHKSQAVVHAQEYISGLYRQLGFVTVGERFSEAGIAHVKMVKQLQTMPIQTAIEPDKSALRSKFLQQRQSLSTTQWQTKSNLICDRLKNWSLFQQAQTILAYFSFRQEVDLSGLFDLDKNWAFPRCVGKNLVWHSWQSKDSLQLGKYGIKEPLITAKEIDPKTANLILVPTVACDRSGYRLGYGGGYYDRLLSSKSCFGVPTVGIVFDFAYVNKLPVDVWDIKLNFICTETKLDRY